MELAAHGLTGSPMMKVLIDGEEVTTKVEIINADKFRVSKPLLGETVFIYGQVISDFKLLDSDRLLPVVFNAVKQLHAQNTELRGQLTMQQAALQSVLARLDKLEASA